MALLLYQPLNNFRNFLSFSSFSSKQLPLYSIFPCGLLKNSSSAFLHSASVLYGLMTLAVLDPVIAIANIQCITLPAILSHPGGGAVTPPLYR
ncbi:hypothetical protein, partial [Pseudomonas syringae group genomosp. 3]|uniref:hypothetical protein n=2 Tax=Pseudomonas syringae group genomosp. 3 TaxID=251701 RepID=UPI001C7EF56B